MKTNYRIFFMLLTASLLLGCAGFHFPIIAPNPFAGVRIVVDPGHGGLATDESPTGGATGPTGLREPDVNLRVALCLKKMLEQEGARVWLTRSTDRRMTPIGSSYSQELNARCRVAEEKHADLFVSIHHNAPGPGRDPKEVNNTSSYSYVEPLPAEVFLADSIAFYVSMELGLPNTGALKGDYHVLRENPRPAVISEASFISNPDEETRLRDNEYLQREARGILRGIEDYLRRYPWKKERQKEMAKERQLDEKDHYIARFVPFLSNPARAEVDPALPFGLIDPETGQPRCWSSFLAAEQAPIYAAGEGTVILVRTMGKPTADLPYEKCVVIEHPNIREGLVIYTIYGNLKDVLAYPGQSVDFETVVGTAGDPNIPEKQFRFEVRVGKNCPSAAENPELWILHPQNRNLGTVVGHFEGEDDMIPVKGLSKSTAVGEDVPIRTYAAGANPSSLWQENFAVCDVVPGTYYLIMADESLEIEVKPERVTRVNFIVK